MFSEVSLYSALCRKWSLQTSVTHQVIKSKTYTFLLLLIFICFLCCYHLIMKTSGDRKRSKHAKELRFTYFFTAGGATLPRVLNVGDTDILQPVKIVQMQTTHNSLGLGQKGKKKRKKKRTRSKRQKDASLTNWARYQVI